MVENPSSKYFRRPCIRPTWSSGKSRNSPCWSPARGEQEQSSQAGHCAGCRLARRTILIFRTVADSEVCPNRFAGTCNRVQLHELGRRAAGPIAQTGLHGRQEPRYRVALGQGQLGTDHHFGYRKPWSVPDFPFDPQIACRTAVLPEGTCRSGTEYIQTGQWRRLFDEFPVEGGESRRVSAAGEMQCVGKIEATAIPLQRAGNRHRVFD